LAVPAVGHQPHSAVSIYGQISGHLIRARETALAHRSGNLLEKLTIDALVLQIDAVIVIARKLHHQEHL
jgi:hypothetical protein